MSSTKKLLLSVILVSYACAAKAQPVHVWEMQELTFTAETRYENPYTDVTVWIELSGPNFNKKVYGFWDGGNVFKVRVVATHPGVWTWKSYSSPDDPTGSLQTLAQPHLMLPYRRGSPEAPAADFANRHHALRIPRPMQP